MARQTDINSFLSQSGSFCSSSGYPTPSSSHYDCEESVNSMCDDDIESESECELYNEPVAKKHRETSDGGHHRKSGFNSTWVREYKWLEYVEKDGRQGILCKLCMKHGKGPRNEKGMDFCTLFYIEKRYNQETCCK